jgi:hypothetical protein
MLWDARQRGASFEKTLTIGHQNLYLRPREVRALRREYLAKAAPPRADLLANYRFGDYSDRFLQDLLGIASLEVLDHSPYEGATIIHDLNQPVAADRWGQYDVIVDGGSLEHVFNFPVAVSNLMRMLKRGGSLFLHNPANNKCGHGFYQFSPELMYRVFAPENGFELKQVVFLECANASYPVAPVRNAYRVSDTAAVGQRVELVSRQPVVMLVEAVKTDDVAPFAVPPQQSFYVSLWGPGGQPEGGPAQHPKGVGGRLYNVLRKLPLSVKSWVWGHYLGWQASFYNKRFYQKM